MWHFRLFVTFLVLIVLTSLASSERAYGKSPFSVERDSDGIWFYEDEDPIYFYQVIHKATANGTHRRANYIHPLLDLDGNIITEDFPEDHLHHRGIFWAWHQVRVNGENIGDNWECKEFNWRVVDPLVTRRTKSVDLLVNVTWSSSLLLDDNKNPAPIIHEQTRIRLHTTRSMYRVLDFEIQLQAIQPNVSIGGSEDDKGYGGFSPRLRMPVDPVFTGPSGNVEPQRTAVAAGQWIDIVGQFGPDDQTSGVTIITHPDNPGYPEPWILRKSGSMQNAMFPGRHAVPLGKGDEGFTLRYRLVTHRGSTNTALLNRLARQFAK